MGGNQINWFLFLELRYDSHPLDLGLSVTKKLKYLIFSLPSLKNP